MAQILDWLSWAPAWARPWFVALSIIGVTWLLARAFVAFIRWRRQQTTFQLYDAFVHYLAAPLSGLLPVIVANIINGQLAFEATGQQEAVKIVLHTLAYSFGAWAFIGLTDVLADAIRRQYHLNTLDNLRERKIITQLEYIRKIVIIIVTVVAIAFVLLQFEQVRKVGTGLLASAGVAGILIGVAAQKSIANLLAGFQIAFTQPIRIDDVVVLEGEFGWIEEITLTYVVVRIWDQRRLVVPLQYFIEKPFQNWTRKNSEILGTVFLYVDYTLPVQAIREELDRYLPTQSLWDERVVNVVIIESHPQAMQLRILVSGRNAGETFDLRCAVREHLITFIQENYPASLVRTRVDMVGEHTESGVDTNPFTSSKKTPPS